MKCLNCSKEFHPKKETRKYCSDSCRVMYNRKHGKKNPITKGQLQVVYNAILELLADGGKDLPKDYLNPKKVAVLKPDGNIEPLNLSKPPSQQVFQMHMNKISKLVFSDEREDYVPIIQSDDNLSEKQKGLLLINLRNSKG